MKKKKLITIITIISAVSILAALLISIFMLFPRNTLEYVDELNSSTYSIIKHKIRSDKIVVKEVRQLHFSADGNIKQMIIEVITADQKLYQIQYDAEKKLLSIIPIGNSVINKDMENEFSLENFINCLSQLKNMSVGYDFQLIQYEMPLTGSSIWLFGTDGWMPYNGTAINEAYLSFQLVTSPLFESGQDEKKNIVLFINGSIV